MIRDFAKNLIEVRGVSLSDGSDVPIRQVDKQTWTIENVMGDIQIRYQVYAWDLSVRSAHLDQIHGFFNGSSVFLCVEEMKSVPCEVLIQRPERFKNWQVATGLKRHAGTEFCGFGRYYAKDYDTLIDCPVEMGTFDLKTFDVKGVPHHLVITGKHRGDLTRCARDLTKLCEHHIDLFGELPCDEYWFLTTVVGDGFGGLEHRNSTALLCSRDDLPNPNQPEEMSEGYQTFLSLCSHEYFHTWNVKRLRPKVFIPFQLSEEVYTEQLWAYEGITSYYDDFSLYRTGLIPAERYLKALGKTISRVYRGHGQHRQSVAESSFNAWTKFYKQDENALNAIVSYYTKGSIIAFGLDLKILHHTQGKKSLDDVMRALWERFGRDESGTENHDFQKTILDVTGWDCTAFLEETLYNNGEVPIADLCSTMGIRFDWVEESAPNALKPSESSDTITHPWLGVGLKSAPMGVTITHVLNHGDRANLGLSAGDNLIALDDLKVSLDTIQSKLDRYAVGETVKLTVFRRDELMNIDVCLAHPPKRIAAFTIESEEKSSTWLRYSGRRDSDIAN